MAEFILKNSYGKETTFNHDKIFVKDKNGELIQFTQGTGGAEAVLESLEVTENGTYTPREGVDGFGSVTVDVDPTRVTVFPETILAESALDDTFGYVVTINPTPFTMALGEKYFVNWDGVEYECTVKDGSMVISNTLYVGNAAALGIENTGEPFVIAVTRGTTLNCICLTDTAPTIHTLKVQKFIPEVVLQDTKTITENGTYTADEGFDGLRSVSVDVPDPVLQNKTVTENGEYTADAGFDGLGKVTVEVAGSGGDVKGAPFLKKIALTTTNTNKTNVDTTQTLSIPKGARILRAWKNAVYNIGKTYHSFLSSVREISLDLLEIDTTNTAYDTVSYTHKSGLGSNSSYNTFEFHVLIATDALTVKDAGDGLCAGTVNKAGEYFKFDSTDRGVEQIMYLKTLDFAEGITEVTKYVCYNQVFLDSVDLSKIETILDSAFRGCTSLKSVSFGSGLKSIGDNAFYRTGLETVDIADSVTSIGNSAFNSCASLKSVTLGENVTSLGTSAFSSCTALETVSLNDNLTSIGRSAFYECTSLSGDLVIPSGITTIPPNAFVKTKFDRVVFPANLSSIDSFAFENCTHPTEFDFSACTKVPSMTLATSLGVVGNGQVLKIPSALFDSWSTKSGWSSWASQMVAV